MILTVIWTIGPTIHLTILCTVTWIIFVPLSWGCLSCRVRLRVLENLDRGRPNMLVAKLLHSHINASWKQGFQRLSVPSLAAQSNRPSSCSSTRSRILPVRSMGMLPMRVFSYFGCRVGRFIYVTMLATLVCLLKFILILVLEIDLNIAGHQIWK